jgi:hypothetical protein
MSNVPTTPEIRFDLPYGFQQTFPELDREYTGPTELDFTAAGLEAVQKAFADGGCLFVAQCSVPAVSGHRGTMATLLLMRHLISGTDAGLEAWVRRDTDPAKDTVHVLELPCGPAVVRLSATLVDPGADSLTLFRLQAFVRLPGGGDDVLSVVLSTPAVLDWQAHCASALRFLKSLDFAPAAG